MDTLKQTLNNIYAGLERDWRNTVKIGLARGWIRHGEPELVKSPDQTTKDAPAVKRRVRRGVRV